MTEPWVSPVHTTNSDEEEGYRLAGEALYALAGAPARGAAPIGWKVKIGLEARIGGYVLVARCSCGYDSGRDGGDGAWERTARTVGQHVKDTHLKKFGDWV